MGRGADKNGLAKASVVKRAYRETGRYSYIHPETELSLTRGLHCTGDVMFGGRYMVCV